MQSEEPFRNVCDVIVPNGYCSGCGVCAGVCASLSKTPALRMEWGRLGTLIPVADNERCKDCGSCLRACPFWNQEENGAGLAEKLFSGQRGAESDPVLGLYLDLYAGYSKVRGHRENRSGGGLATWFLETLLKRKIVDRVACVMPGTGPDNLFRFALLDSADELGKCARSAYYPVEVSKVVAEICRVKGRYALIGLPCVIKGVRLASRELPRLRERLVITAGLVCGQARSRFFAEYLCAKSKGDASRLESASFRVKDLDRHHLDHRFEFTCGNGIGASRGHVYQTEGMGWLWGHDCFKVGACNFCDDITSELADVSFGDAVDEPYCYGNRGANFVIVRSDAARDILERGAREGELFLEKAPKDAVLKRQEGVVLLKRRDLGHRLYLLHRQGAPYIPVKRTKPGERLDQAENSWMELRDALRLASTETYSKHRHERDVVPRVEGVMHEILEANKGVGPQ